MIPYFVFGLCTLTSALCAWALLAQYRRSGFKLLFWSSLCFVGFTVNNLLLLVDYYLGPRTDLSIGRIIPGLLGIATLLIGFIWEPV